MLRRRIADVSFLHVYGNCSYHGVVGHHLPLWSRPTNMRQPKTQTKLMLVKKMMFLAILEFRIEQHFLSMQKFVHLGKSVYAWVATNTRRGWKGACKKSINTQDCHQHRCRKPYMTIIIRIERQQCVCEDTVAPNRFPAQRGEWLPSCMCRGPHW